MKRLRGSGSGSGKTGTGNGNGGGGLGGGSGLSGRLWNGFGSHCHAKFSSYKTKYDGLYGDIRPRSAGSAGSAGKTGSNGRNGRNGRNPKVTGRNRNIWSGGSRSDAICGRNRNFCGNRSPKTTRKPNGRSAHRKVNGRNGNVYTPNNRFVRKNSRNPKSRKKNRRNPKNRSPWNSLLWFSCKRGWSKCTNGNFLRSIIVCGKDCLLDILIGSPYTKGLLCLGLVRSKFRRRIKSFSVRTGRIVGSHWNLLKGN